MPPVPLVGVPCDRKQIGHHCFHAVAEKYIRALVDAAACLPVLIPSLAPPVNLREMLARFDGLFLPGAYSNIEPHHYGNESSWPENLHDPARDTNTLSLVPLAIEMKVPVLAVCRGLQEVNVALGGTLYQKVHETPSFHDHRENHAAPLDVQYGPAHPVRLAANGILAKISDQSEVIINSLHGQGIRDIGRNLRVEATAPDGLVEAISLNPSDTFLLAVQWHPEWKVNDNSFYLGIFQEFAAACRTRAAQRT